jgi:hypothetical protein
MEKIDLVIKPIKNIKIDFQDQIVLVQPYIDSASKVALISEYINNLYEDNGDDWSSRYVIAELVLITHIIDICTNINVDKSFSVDNLIDSGLWEEISSRIKNYYLFRDDLHNALKLYEFEYNANKMLGSVFENLLGKLELILSKVGSMDAKDLQSSIVEFSKQMKDLNNQIPGIISKKPATRKKKEIIN